MAEAVSIIQFELGPWDNFIYLLADRATGTCALVDPAWHAPSILKRAEAEGLKITHILCTHSHFDHVDAVAGVLSKTDAQVHMLREEVAWSGFSSENLIQSRPGDTLTIGKHLNIKMVHTPGHTPGSVSYLFDQGRGERPSLITGDTLFIDGCGRCDFVGGDPKVMYGTLKTLTTALPGETLLYPGHNYGPTLSASIKDQRGSNPFLTQATLEDFVNHRMKGKTPNTTLPTPGPWSPPEEG